ncbi:hypothetical protein VE03_00561 [Pseudogymnoascus sp. 23342-1-I1]|nr:hypothetical protein VE03_00561 [Pseudogymnoascus sp. 23342-1-I1]
MDATGSSAPPSALRLLSLGMQLSILGMTLLTLYAVDGGGIRGISALVILEEVMHRVQRAEGLSSVPLPADYFDLICGTSTGGLIAILLGRLRLSVPEAIDKYRILAAQVFSEKKTWGKDGTFKASNLEKAIKEVVQEKLGPGHADERMFTTEGCKTFVCAVPAKHITTEPRLFRTWKADKCPGPDCTIWEAGRATSAAPTFFKRIYIGKPHLQEEFIDAAMGCNNPVKSLIKEAQREFGLVRKVSCVLSIGTGMPKVSGFEAPGLIQRALPLDLINVLARMAADSDAVALEMKARYQNCPGLYHRLNVERGLEGVALEEWKKLGEVKTHTMTYLGQDDISTDVDVIVKALVGKSSKTFSLGRLDGAVPGYNDVRPEDKSDRKFETRFIVPIGQNENFVGRNDILQQLNKRLFKQEFGQTRVILWGMMGIGKTQIALELAYRRAKIQSVFWTDASTMESFAQSFMKIGDAAGILNPDTKDQELDIVTAWLDSENSGSWLLIVDNFQNLEGAQERDAHAVPRGLLNSLPVMRGAILFTTHERNIAHTITKDSHSKLHVPVMGVDEAIS